MWVTSLPGVGVEVAAAGKNVNEVAEETRAFFADSGRDRLANYEQGYVVQRVPLDDSDAETSMGIFLRISPER